MQYVFLIRCRAGGKKYVTRLRLMTYFLPPALERIKNTYCMGQRPFLYFYIVLCWVWCDWPLTLLTGHWLSVLWHCWLGGSLIWPIKSSPKWPIMTYNVSNRTLKRTVLYCTCNKRSQKSSVVKYNVKLLRVVVFGWSVVYCCVSRRDAHTF